MAAQPTESNDAVVRNALENATAGQIQTANEASPGSAPDSEEEKVPKLTTSAHPSIAAERYVITSKAGTQPLGQAPKTCWDHLLPFPQNGPNKAGRADAEWLPYLHALGLQQDVFPSIEVQSKAVQAHGSNNKRPDWGFMAYNLIALSPKGRLMSREIYNLSLAWCPKLSANNNSCRHSLCLKSKPWKELILDDYGCYTLRDLTAQGPAPIISDTKVVKPVRRSGDSGYGSLNKVAEGGQKRKISDINMNDNDKQETASPKNRRLESLISVPSQKAVSTCPSSASCDAKYSITSKRNLIELRRQERLFENHMKQPGGNLFLRRPTGEWLEQVRGEIELAGSVPSEGGRYLQRHGLAAYQKRYPSPLPRLPNGRTPLPS